MTDLIDELRQTAGNLINGVIDDGEVPVSLLTEAADEIERLRAAQPEAFTGCQLRGPGECQNHGMCLSDACLHAGKTIRPRYMAEPREDGIKYPSFAERNLIDRFGPKVMARIEIIQRSR